MVTVLGEAHSVARGKPMTTLLTVGLILIALLVAPLMLARTSQSN